MHKITFFLIFAMSILHACKPVENYILEKIAMDFDDQSLYLLMRLEQKSENPDSNFQLWRQPIDQGHLAFIAELSHSFANGNAKIGGMVWDSVHQRIIISEVNSATIYTVDPSSGAHAVLSGASQGAGPLFGKLSELVLDQDNARLFVIDELINEQGATRLLTSVNLNTGDRSIVAVRGMWAGPLKQARAITYDATQNQIYLSYGSGVLRVDGFSGELHIFSDAQQNVGLGSQLVQANTIHFDNDRHRLLLTDALMREVIAIHLATGDRTIVIDGQESAHAGLCWAPSAVFYNDQLYVADAANRQVLRVKVSENAWQVLLRIGKQQAFCLPAVVAANEITAIHNRQCKVLTTQGILTDIAVSADAAIQSTNPIVRAFVFPFVYSVNFLLAPTTIIWNSFYEVYGWINAPPTQDCVQFPGWVVVMAPLLLPISLPLILFGFGAI